MFANIGNKVFEIAVYLAPAAQATGLDSLAEQAQNLLVQAALFLGLPLIMFGFLLMMLSGVNPQWKQKGIETVKWAMIGTAGTLFIAGILWTWLTTTIGTAGGGS